MTKTTIPAEDMDAILDDALDELDDSDSDDNGEEDNLIQVSHQTEPVSPEASTPGESKDKRNIPFGPPRPPPPTPKTPSSTNHPTKPDRAPADDDLGGMEDSLRQMFRDLAVESQPPSETATGSKPTKTGTKTSPTKSQSAGSKQSAVSDEEKMLQDLFQGLMNAEAEESADGMPNMDEIPDLDNLFAGLGGGDGPTGSGAGFNTDHFMEGMMEQLLSKELMYEPMKQVTDKFPEWLASKKDTLSAEEWDQRNRQYDCFRRLVQAYESEEERKETSKLLEIMQEVQEYGQPPPEIINEIAPGLELDEEGLPKMNGGVLPPFLGGNPGPEDCRIM